MSKGVSVFTNLLLFAVALCIAILGFYALDHGVMNMQGLPLNWDLTPMQ